MADLGLEHVSVSVRFYWRFIDWRSSTMMKVVLIFGLAIV